MDLDYRSFAKRIITLCIKKENDFTLFNCLDLIQAKKDMEHFENWNFRFCNFYNILCETEFDAINLWFLNILNILPLNTYVKNLKPGSALFKNFIQSIQKLFSMDSSSDKLISFVQGGIMTYLVDRRFDSSFDNHVMQVASSAINHVVSDIIQTTNTQDCKIRQNAISLLWNCGNVKFQSLQSFCLFFLQNMLQVQKSDNIFLLQESCKNRQHPFHLSVLLDKVVKTVDVEDVVELLRKDLCANESNMDGGCLVIIDSLLKVYGENNATLIGLFNSLVNKSFETTNTNYLKKAVMILRQAVFSSTDSLSIAYRNWFHTHVYGNVHFKIPDNFTLLIMALTDMLPYENNQEILKLSVEHQGNVPTECQIMYMDYILLVKTKIKDLEPQVKPEEIIEKLLVGFEENGKIPPYVFETSLMQKNFFINEFVPALLSPRVIPITPDSREKFIKILLDAGKIPVASYKKYKAESAEKARNAYKTATY